MLTSLLFALNLVSGLAMFGLIWFVQLVHYPLFLRAEPATFIAFETDHANRTGYLAFPLMVTELGTAILMAWPRLRPAAIPQVQAELSLALVLLTWASTVFRQIPLHNRLHRGFDRPTIQRLVATNWLRTLAWSARTALIAAWLRHLAATAR